MTTFNAQHPRATTGTFVEKNVSAPDSPLFPLHDQEQDSSTFIADTDVLPVGWKAEPWSAPTDAALHEANLAAGLLLRLHARGTPAASAE